MAACLPSGDRERLLIADETVATMKDAWKRLGVLLDYDPFSHGQVYSHALRFINLKTVRLIMQELIDEKEVS